MKLRKIFTGMAASAIALTAFAMSASAYSAGVTFQADGTWNFRNSYGADQGTLSQNAAFPAKMVGVQGGGSGFDASVDCTDIDFTVDGTYTVAIAASGTIDTDAQVYDDGTQREGDALKWSMSKNYEIKDGATVDGSTSSAFNMIGITTDIPVDLDDSGSPIIDDDGNAVVNGKSVKISDITLKCGSETYTMTTAPQKSDSEYVTVMMINKWGKEEGYLDQSSVAVPGDGETVEITFTISGLDSDSSNSTPTSSTDSNTSSTGSSSSSASSTSSSASTTSTKSTTTTNGTTATSTASTSSTASDNTNTSTGATAGIALAGIALAGAAAVVAKRK
jgi:hypothetical protein